MPTIHIYMQKHIQHNKDERTQFFRKIYLSLYSKGLRKGYCVRGELENEQRLKHIDPHSSGYSRISFPFFWAAQQGAWGPSLCWVWFSLLELEHWLQTLISNWFTSCRTRVISLFDVHLLPVASQFALNSTRRQSRLSPDIFDRMHLFFYTGAFPIWQLDRIGGQYVTAAQQIKKSRIHTWIRFYSLFWFVLAKTHLAHQLHQINPWAALPLDLIFLETK